MSKNFTAKTSPKWLLWSIISAVLVLISIIVMAIPSVGVNTAKEARSSATLTVNVSMSQTFYPPVLIYGTASDDTINIFFITPPNILNSIHYFLYIILLFLGLG